jgi:hypothetical protein
VELTLKAFFGEINASYLLVKFDHEALALLCDTGSFLNAANRHFER